MFLVAKIFQSWVQIVCCETVSYCALKMKEGISLLVQQLRLHAPNVGGLGLIPGQETRSHMPKQRPRAAKSININIFLKDGRRRNLFSPLPTMTFKKGWLPVPLVIPRQCPGRDWRWPPVHSGCQNGTERTNCPRDGREGLETPEWTLPGLQGSLWSEH